MNNRYCYFLSLLLVAMMVSVFFVSCNNDAMTTSEEPSQEFAPDTRAVGNKTPKLAVYIETNDINPLNAGEYYFCNSNPREEVVDLLILFASNIRGNATSAWLHHNPNQTYILNNMSTLVAPLQAKGIKVLLGLLGDHTGVGFSNMTSAMRSAFISEVTTCVNTYGFDGVDIDDEYAKYGDISTLPASSILLGDFVEELRDSLPNGKLITGFHYGPYMTGLSQADRNIFDYLWPNYGCHPNPPTGFPAGKWAKLSYNFEPPSMNCPAIQSCVRNYTGYGAIMTFNLRETDFSGVMNCFSSVWGRSICRTNVVHEKDYPPIQ